MGTRIAVIGYGEVGRIFTADLLAAGAERVATFDILFRGADGERLRGVARTAGVLAADSAEEACRDADVVISAVTASSAEDVAVGLAPALRPGQMLLDVNSASPSTKARSAERVVAAGASFVEGAVMASVPGPRLRVPILGGGPDAEKAAALLNPLGMNITPVSTEVGRASATKLCRSIIIKGLEALLIDCATAGERWGVADDVFASLSATFPSVDWKQLSVDMPTRVRAHGIRRAAEMREAAQMLEELGLSPDLALAVADRQQANAAAKPAAHE